MPQTFPLRLTDLQPSQLYISRQKLARVRAWWAPSRLDALPPIPVVLLDGVVVATDGHTRAFAATTAGFTIVPAVWDTDELDWTAYRMCVDWCRDVGIRTVMDLTGKVVSAADYEELWLARCRRMHRTLD